VPDGDPASTKKAAQPPSNFSPCLLWLKGWIDQDVTWYRGRPWPRPHCVRWGPSSPKGTLPPFSPHICCSQTVGWIMMPLGTEEGLGPGHIVLNEDSALLSLRKKGHSSLTTFRPMSIVAKQLDGSRCHLVRRCLGDNVLDGDPAPLNGRPSQQRLSSL